MGNQIVKAEPMTLIEQAVAGGVDIEKLKGLFDLQERWEKQHAKKAFYLALSNFQAQIPVIIKTENVNFTNKTGSKTNYNYASLPSIIAQTKNAFADNGLSYRWEFRDEKDLIYCSCTLTHIEHYPIF